MNDTDNKFEEYYISISNNVNMHSSFPTEVLECATSETNIYKFKVNTKTLEIGDIKLTHKYFPSKLQEIGE